MPDPAGNNFHGYPPASPAPFCVLTWNRCLTRIAAICQSNAMFCQPKDLMAS